MWHASGLDPAALSRACTGRTRSCMLRYVLIILGVVALGWAIAALATSSASLDIGSGSKTAAASPPCALSSPERSAQLPGSHVFASPAPDSAVANPRTQISFLGAPAASIGTVSAVGSDSGSHQGRLAPYSQGDGVSFVPAKP